MHFKVSDSPSEQLDEFAVKEWAVWDNEHYGQTTQWDSRHCYFEAWDRDELVGIAVGKSLLNVFELEQLLIKHTHHRKGLGKKLLEEVEKFCRNEKYHKIILSTGVGWKAEHFYDALGYERIAVMKNHYLHKDFILYSKIIY